MTTKRPTGVTIIAVLNLIGGILSVLVGFLGLIGIFTGGIERLETAAGSEEQAAGIGAAIAIYVAISLISGILSLIVAYGLFKLKKWAWFWTIAVQVINIIVAFLGLFSGGNALGSIFIIAIAGLIFYYLNRPNVKQAFGKA